MAQSSEAQEIDNSPITCVSMSAGPVSLPSSISPSVEQSCPVFRYPRCKYTRISHGDLRDIVIGMNVSVGKVISNGAYAKVTGVYSNSRNQLMVLKVIRKKSDSAGGRCTHHQESLRREIMMLWEISTIRHPYVVSAHNIVETKDQAFILMDMAENGSLTKYINGRGCLPEPEARYLFSQLTQAVKLLHSKGIAHRHLKCDNILLDRNMCIKITNFSYGIKFHCPLDSELTSGSTQCSNAFRTDVQSMGFILFLMVHGRQNRKTSEHVASISPDFKDLIGRILQSGGFSSCDEVGRHSWMVCGRAVRPPQPFHFATRYTKNNLSLR